MNIIGYVLGALIAVFGILFKKKDSELKSEKKRTRDLTSQLVNSEKKRVTQEFIIKKAEAVAAKNKTQQTDLEKKEGDLIEKVNKIQNNKEATEEEKKEDEINFANAIYSGFNNRE